MGMIVDTAVNKLYKAFPQLPEIERKTEKIVNDARQTYDFSNRLANYLLDRKGYISAELETSFSELLGGLKRKVYSVFDELKKGFTVQPVQYTPPIQYTQHVKEAVKKPVEPAAKKENLETIVKDVKEVKAAQEFEEIKEVKEIKAVKEIQESKPIIKSDNKYIDDSVRIAELYNQGYNTKSIVKEAATRGYAGVKNYKDIAERVAIGINTGASYARKNYNSLVAEKLGAKEQVIQDYLSGKSYKEIKESLKKTTNGMSISDSTILRIMHDYEDKTGSKVVGKRNGGYKAEKQAKVKKK